MRTYITYNSFCSSNSLSYGNSQPLPLLEFPENYLDLRKILCLLSLQAYKFLCYNLRGFILLWYHLKNYLFFHRKLVDKNSSWVLKRKIYFFYPVFIIFIVNFQIILFLLISLYWKLLYCCNLSFFVFSYVLTGCLRNLLRFIYLTDFDYFKSQLPFGCRIRLTLLYQISFTIFCLIHKQLKPFNDFFYSRFLTFSNQYFINYNPFGYGPILPQLLIIQFALSFHNNRMTFKLILHQKSLNPKYFFS